MDEDKKKKEKEKENFDFLSLGWEVVPPDKAKKLTEFLANRGVKLNKMPSIKIPPKTINIGERIKIKLLYKEKTFLVFALILISYTVLSISIAIFKNTMGELNFLNISMWIAYAISIYLYCRSMKLRSIIKQL